MSKILNLSNENFNETIEKDKNLILVDFWAAWCGPCKMIAPVLEEISDELSDKVIVVKVNIDECEEIARKFSIMSIPTLLLLKEGKVISKSIGVKSKQSIVDLINANV